MSRQFDTENDKKQVPRADELRELLKAHHRKLEDKKNEKINKVKREVDRMLQDAKEEIIAGNTYSSIHYLDIPGFSTCDSKAEIVHYIGSLGYDIMSHPNCFNWRY